MVGGAQWALPALASLWTAKTSKVLSIVEPFEWEFAGVNDLLAQRGVRMSMQQQADFGGIDPDRLQDSVQFIEDVLRTSPDAKVYVHCKAGRGRSAAAIMAYLSTPHGDLSSGPVNLAVAHYIVRTSRSHINVGSNKINDLHQYYIREVLGSHHFWEPDGASTAARLHIEARERLWKAQDLDDDIVKELLDAYKDELVAAIPPVDKEGFPVSCPDFSNKAAGNQSRTAHTFCNTGHTRQRFGGLRRLASK